MHFVNKWLGATIFSVIGAVSPSHAAFIAHFAQVGSDVVITGTGSLDLGGGTRANSNNLPGFIEPSFANAQFGLGDYADGYVFDSIPGPGNLGAGEYRVSDFSSGDVVGLIHTANFIVVPVGYVFGSALSDTSTYQHETLSSLGITPGTYVYNLPNDTFTIEVASLSTVPLPASFPMFGAALLALGTVGYGVRRKKGAAAA